MLIFEERDVRLNRGYTRRMAPKLRTSHTIARAAVKSATCFYLLMPCLIATQSRARVVLNKRGETSGLSRVTIILSRLLRCRFWTLLFMLSSVFSLHA